MKKIISCIAAFAAIANLFIPIANAEGAVPSKVYADVNGVQATFTSDDTIDTNTCSLKLAGDEVAGSFSYNELNHKLTFTPEAKLERDKIYTLDIDGASRQFEIKTIFYEDFDDVEDTYISDSTPFENAYGSYTIATTSSTDGSAMVKDGKLYLAGAKLSIDEYENDPESGFNMSADISAYGKKYTTASGTTGTANKSRATVYFNSNNNIGVAYKYKTVEIGYWNDTTFTKSVASTSGSTYSTESGEFPFGKLTNDAKLIDEDTYSALTYDAECDAKNVSIFADGTSVVGRTDKDEAISLEDSKVDGSEASIEASASTLSLVDNIIITTYTEDVAPPEEGEVKATGLDGDFDALYLNFDRSLKGTKHFDSIKVYRDGEDVSDSCTFTLDKDGYKKLTIVPEGKIYGYTYKVTIASGFGTKLLQTATDYEFSFELQKNEITIDDIAGGKDNITATLSEDLTDFDASSSVEIYDNDGNLCESKVEVSGNKLIVTPESYFQKGKLYQIYIHDIELDESILKTPLRKSFKFEDIYANDFDGNLFGDGVSFSGTAMKRDDPGLTRQYSRSGVSCTISEGRATEEENVDINFDLWIYWACMNNDDKGYEDGPVPYCFFEFNCPDKRYSDAVSAEQLYWSSASVYFNNKIKGSSKLVSSTATQALVYGDIYQKPDNTFQIIQKGDTLPIPQANQAGDMVTVSQRDESPRYHIEFIKQGSKITMLKTLHTNSDYNDCSGESTETLVFDAPNGSATVGDIYMISERLNAWAMDNFTISMLTFVDNDGVEISNASYTAIAGNVTASAKLFNYGENKLPMNVVVAAYGDNDQMLAMKTSSITSIQAYGSQDIAETFPVDGDVKYVKIYAIDGYSTLKVYSIKKLTN